MEMCYEYKIGLHLLVYGTPKFQPQTTSDFQGSPTKREIRKKHSQDELSANLMLNFGAN